MTEPDLFASQWRDISEVLADPHSTDPQREPTAAPGRQVPELTPGENSLLYLTVTLLLAVGTIGLLASYQSVTAAATRWGFETPQLLPIAIDLAIPGFTIANLLLIRMDMELAWVRAVPWTLTATTVYLNIQAGHSLAARIGHGALPLVWVVCSEIAGHVYRVIIGAATGKRMERIRRSRWFLAPISTGSLWRRMVLWDETSYTTALHRERDRLLARAGLRETYGKRWRSKSPLRDRVLLKLGDLNPSEVMQPETGETETVAGAHAAPDHKAETQDRRDLCTTETVVRGTAETPGTTAETSSGETKNETPRSPSPPPREPEPGRCQHLWTGTQRPRSRPC